MFKQLEEKDAYIAELSGTGTVGALDAKVEASKANRMQALEDTIVGLRRANESQAPSRRTRRRSPRCATRSRRSASNQRAGADHRDAPRRAAVEGVVTDDQIIAACATPFERRYLFGNGYDTSATSYRYNRGEILREIRERYEHRRAETCDGSKLAELRQITTVPTDTAGRRALGETIARAYGVSVEMSKSIPAGTYAFSNWSQRRITLPPDWADSSEGLAAFLHETGHIIAGPCPKTAPHQGHRVDQRWWHCLACETVAWERAMHTAPFSRAMFHRLQGALRTYRRTTPGPPEAKDALRRVASDSYYAARVQARAEHERRLAMAAEIEQLASTPRVLTRQERQWQDIQAMLRGVGL